MNKAPQPVWVVPYDPSDMAPLPAIMEEGSRFAVYDRHKKDFGPMEVGLYTPYDSFEACRAAMIAERSQALRGMHDESRQLAASIEHIRTIPSATFPNVQREVRAQGQQEQQEAQGQEKIEGQQEKVIPAKTELKRPSRK